MEFTTLTSTMLILYILLSGATIYSVFLYYRYRTQIEHKYTLLFTGSHQVLASFLLVLAFLVISLSILGPKIGKQVSNQETQGIDISIVLDVSKSMNALDFENEKDFYSRIEAAKILLKNYVTSHPENRYSLIVFAGEATNISPLTSDTNIFLNFLQSVDYKNLVSQGTNIEKAYEMGIKRLSVDSENSALIILSDGGDEDDAIKYAEIEKIQKEANIYTLVIGIGSMQGARIPNGRDIFGYTTYQMFNGSEVITKLNETNLKKLANAASGDYVSIETLDTIDILETSLKNIETKAIERGASAQKSDASRYLAVISFLLLLFYIYFSYYRKSSHIHHIHD